MINLQSASVLRTKTKTTTKPTNQKQKQKTQRCVEVLFGWGLSFPWPCHAACGILVLQLGFQPVLPAVEVESEPLDYQGSPQKFVFLIKRYTIFSTDSTIDDMCQESIKYKMMTSHFKSSCTTGFYQPEQHSFSCRGEEHLLTLPSKVRWLLFWLVAGERWGQVYLLHILFRYSTNKIHETWKIHERVTVAQLCPILCNPMNCSLEFSRQEYWNE